MRCPSLVPVTALLLIACAETDRSFTGPQQGQIASSLGALTSSAPASVFAGPIVNPANGHSYYLLNPDNWTNSEAGALTLGGHLVTINNQPENDWVFATFSSYGAVSRSLWIGFTDQLVEGMFVWASGENPGYTNWSAGQPNNGVTASRGPESFAHFWSPDFITAYGFPAGSWNDYVDLDTVDGTTINGVAEVERPVPLTKDDCKNGGWQSLARADGSTFRNQGDCIQYVNTGK